MRVIWLFRTERRGSSSLVSKIGRNPHSQRIHDMAVRLIAGDRFAVEDWKVAINPAAEQNDSIEHVDRHLIPDIIARHEGGIVALGEVETHESISEEEVAQWVQLGQLCSRLYLFVPHGTEQTAAELIVRHGVSCAGLRAYSLGEDNTLSIESVHIPNGHFKANDHEWWSNIGKN
jgi:hypothetical protein